MRRLIVSFVVAGLLAVIGAAPAAADRHVRAVPDAACNQGTERAHEVAGGPAHPHIPHEMGFCMTMPGTHPGP